jgi:hypothetical protein
MNFNFNFAEIAQNATLVVPIVIALVQAVKLTGWIRDHYAPLVAILIGMGIAFLGAGFGTDTPLTLSTIIMGGVVYGLMASGLYSGVKTQIFAYQRVKAEREQENHHNRR